MFGRSIFDEDDWNLFGRNHPLKKFRENQALLDQNPKVFRIDEGKRIKTLAKGYRFKKGIAFAKKYTGNPLEKVYLKTEERECFTMETVDKCFKVIYEVLDRNNGHVIVAYHPKSNGFRLMRHMRVLGEIMFHKYELKSVFLRAGIPDDDIETNLLDDRRMQEISYDTPSGRDTRSRQFLLWLTVCEGAIPENKVNRRASSDMLQWLTPRVELEEDVREELNSFLPVWHRWHF